MDEQTEIPATKRARLEALLENGELADCTFVVQNTAIHAHKLILACSSPVFEKMFYGNLASDHVVITDIQLEDFKQMLQFVYKDSIEIKSVPNAWSLLYMAHKYLLCDLQNLCEDYVQQNLTISNLILSYEYAEMYNILGIQEKCLRDICEFSRGIFMKKYEYHMKSSTILAILRQYNQQLILNTDCNNLFRGVVTWAEYECDIRNIMRTQENVINLLSECNLMEYLLKLELDVDYFDDNTFMTQICKALKQNCNTSIEPRLDMKDHLYIYCKNRQVYKIAGRVELRERDVLNSNLKVNKTVLLFGLVIMTEDEKVGSVSGKYNGRITVYIGANSVTSFVKPLPYETPIYIPLTEPVCLEAHTNYAVTVSYTNLDNLNDLGVRKSSVLCNYMSSTLADKKTKTVFTFDELNGGVIKGLCYYPA